MRHVFCHFQYQGLHSSGTYLELRRDTNLTAAAETTAGFTLITNFPSFDPLASVSKDLFLFDQASSVTLSLFLRFHSKRLAFFTWVGVLVYNHTMEVVLKSTHPVSIRAGNNPGTAILNPTEVDNYTATVH